MKLSSSFESLMMLLSFGSLSLGSLLSSSKEWPCNCKSVGSKVCHDVFIVGHSLLVGGKARGH